MEDVSLLEQYRLDAVQAHEISNWLIFLSPISKPVKLSITHWTLVDSDGLHHPLKPGWYQDRQPPCLYFFSRSDPAVSLKLDETRLRLLLWSKDSLVQYHFFDGKSGS
jgi:hypothetical protein